MNSEQLYQNAMQLDSKGEYQRSISIYKELAKISNDPRHLIAYGVCLQRLGHWKQSIAPLEKGISLRPYYCEGDARLFLAKAFFNSGKKKLAAVAGTECNTVIGVKQVPHDAWPSARS
ncbi:hypothetical protein [Pseudomonas sp. AN-1]|uniref:hypothetical protein n=1 Tax=Pseudomonas sp. AN-1 TaxID=3096605 RepID=UPI002A6A5BC3|nr:hypothetical protein [Pseudomonas sp. AN-1]WPP45814.1 hypothetical protein SK095_21650 [Pseudomonas sp. AN-1]